MRERGTGAAGQDGREPPAIRVHCAVPDREHPAVNADEPPSRDAVANSSRTQPRRYQLIQRDHAVLLARNPPDLPIHVR